MRIIDRIGKVGRMAKLVRLGKTQDSIITGMLGGLIGAIAMDISNLLIFKAGKTESTYARTVATMMVSPSIRAKQKKNRVLGEILHLGTGAFFGLPLVYIFKNTGKDHHLVKGLGASMFTWSVLFTGGQKIGLFKKDRLTHSYYSGLFNNVIYGLVTAQTIVSLADPAMFAQKPKFAPQNELQTEPQSPPVSAAGYRNNYSSDDIEDPGMEDKPSVYYQ